MRNLKKMRQRRSIAKELVLLCSVAPCLQGPVQPIDDGTPYLSRTQKNILLQQRNKDTYNFTLSFNDWKFVLDCLGYLSSRMYCCKLWQSNKYRGVSESLPMREISWLHEPQRAFSKKKTNRTASDKSHPPKGSSPLWVRNSKRVIATKVLLRYLL